MDQQQCIFCGIANGGVPSKKIYEDEKVTVVLDIYPANPAHLLVLTKNHYSVFNQLSQEEAEHLGIISKRLSELLFKVLKPEGINFFIANGPVAGQKAPHFILHAIPRFSGDGLGFDIPFNNIDEKELDAYYENLKGTLKNYFPDVNFDSAPEKSEAGREQEQENGPAQSSEENISKNQQEQEDEKQGQPNQQNNQNTCQDAAEQQKSKSQEEQAKPDDDIDLDKVAENLL